MIVAIAIETPLQDDMRMLIAELNAAMDAQEPETPRQFNFRMTAEEMAGPQTTVWIARLDGAAVGCGALLRHAGGFGEVKRMYVRPSAQGRGIAQAVLERIEDRARREGLVFLALETGGDGYGAARRLYERSGHQPCGAFADYPDNPYSAFFQKTLSRPAAAATDLP